MNWTAFFFMAYQNHIPERFADTSSQDSSSLKRSLAFLTHSSSVPP